MSFGTREPHRPVRQAKVRIYADDRKLETGNSQWNSHLHHTPQQISLIYHLRNLFADFMFPFPRLVRILSSAILPFYPLFFPDDHKFLSACNWSFPDFRTLHG